MPNTVCNNYTRPAGIMGGPCLLCGYTQPEHVGIAVQPPPMKNANPAIQDLVLIDIEARKTLGLERYGTLLQADNGRDMLRDGYEEALDLCIYLRGAIYERDRK